jgi:hypothetical protein
MATGSRDGGLPHPAMRPSGSSWRFLTNHGHVLIYLSRYPDARIRYVTKIKIGRRNRYQLHPDLTFRHPEEAQQPIGALLRIFS